MKICIVSDAWHPQVNGVVTTLTYLVETCKKFDVEIDVIGPDRFRTIAAPSYPEIRLALTTPGALGSMIEAGGYDHLHIATEGPLGLAASFWAVKNKRLFTTSYHTRFPEYVEARWPIPLSVSYRLIRWFHSRSASVMVATQTLANELNSRGFKNLALWPRGIDRQAFHPVEERMDFPRPCFLYCGRVAPEKNIEAFLKLDLPGSKVVVGDGPVREALAVQFPDVIFVGLKKRHELAAYYSNADVFVFPSLTDTFGNVMLEALSCGAPVAAFPVTGPIDVVTDPKIGVLDHDLRAACMRALENCSRDAAVAHASRYSWEESARLFLNNIYEARAGASRKLSTSQQR